MNRDYRSGVMGTVCLLLFIVTGCGTLSAEDSHVNDLTIIDQWSGDFPVADLALLPQRQSRAGYIGGQKAFATVWQAFRPGETTPTVDFERHLVVFARNVDFYNRTQIFKVTLSDGAAEILAMETMSAMPIEDKVAMAMAVIPRAGVRFIRAGEEQIPVADNR
jgi:histidyl-tRNA synthetase